MVQPSFLLLQKVVLTLAYTDQFSYPLTFDELKRRLIGKRIASSQLYEALTILKARNIVSQHDSYYFLSTTPKRSRELVATRVQRARRAQQKWLEVAQLLPFFNALPFIRGVLVTGSLAMNNTVKDDDTDFMIITAKHTLWLVRPLVVVYSWFKGKRRSWQTEEKNSWCFNLWVEEHCLAIPSTQHSVYTAYELCQARWLVADASIKKLYYQKNAWAKRYLPTYYHSCRVAALHTMPASTPVRAYLLLASLVVPLNYLLFIVQRLYMLPHQTTERVTFGAAFFHPRNTRKLLFSRWKQRLLTL